MRGILGPARALAVAVVAGALLLGWQLRPGAEPSSRSALITSDGAYRPGTFAGASAADGDDEDAVVRAVADAVPLALSYDHRTLAADRAAALASMTPAMAAGFGTVFDAVTRDRAVDRRIVTRTLVRGVGLVSLRDDRARAVVFADQFLVRSRVVAAPMQLARVRLRVGMRRVDGRWLLDAIDPV